MLTRLGLLHIPTLQKYSKSASVISKINALVVHMDGAPTMQEYNDGDGDD